MAEHRAESQVQVSQASLEYQELLKKIENAKQEHLQLIQTVHDQQKLWDSVLENKVYLKSSLTLLR